MYPKVIADSNGCPWISFTQLVYQVPNTPPYDAVIIKAATGDGSWTTAPGFPFTLVHKGVEGYPDPAGAALANGKSFWFYNANRDGSDVFAARIWNGKAWEDEEIVAKGSAASYGFLNAVADGDDAHVVYGSGTIEYQKRTWDAGWSQPFQVDGGASGHTSLTRAGPNHLIATWLDTSNDSVRYRELAGGTWGPAVTLAEESAEHLAAPALGINMNALVDSSERFKHAVMYSTGSALPFKIKFAAVTVAPSGDGR
jgi:hypothetical protein